MSRADALEALAILTAAYDRDMPEETARIYLAALVDIDRDGYRVFYKNEAGPSFQQKWNDSPAHYQNFIDCVKSREQEKLVADIEEGHYSAMLCHLGNIAYRTGRRLEFDPKTETFVGDEQANQMLSREYRKGYELPTI